MGQDVLFENGDSRGLILINLEKVYLQYTGAARENSSMSR